MAVKTIAELKALWVNGFIPDQDDYVDLFDTVEALGGDAGGGGNVAFGSGEVNPNGVEDDLTGDQIIDPAVQQLIDDNPTALLFWTDTTAGNQTGEDGENITDENKTFMYIRGTGGGLGGTFSYWIRIVKPVIEQFNRLLRVTDLGGNYDATGNQINSFSAGLIGENVLIYEGSGNLNINVSDGGSTRGDGLVPVNEFTIVNAGTGSITFLSPQNSNGIQLPQGKSNVISGKGVIKGYNKFEGLNTLQYILSGDLDSSESGGSTIQRATQTFRLNELNSTPITLIAAQGIDKAIFVDKVFISLKNYSGFNTTSLFSELKVGQLMFNSPEILLEFGADQREHFVTQGAQTQIVRKNEVTNQPFTWNINPTDEAGFGAGSGTDVEFTVTTYYTVEDILDSNNLPS